MLMTVRERLCRLVTWRRARAYALVLVALYVVAYVDVLVLGSMPLNSGGVPVAGDYIAFHTAARLITSGHASEMYDHAAVVGVQDQLLHGLTPGFYDAYRNPPFYALIYTPLAGLDLLQGFVVWAVLSLACLGLAIKLLLDEVPSLRRRWVGVLIFVFAFAPVYFGLIDGENATVSLLLYVLIYRAFARGQDRALGVWAALGLFKPQLFLVFPLVFLITRRWRSLATYALTALVLFAISFAVVGVDGMQAWLRVLVEHESGNALANGWRMASAKSFFDALLPASAWGSFAAYAAVGLLSLIALARVWTRPNMDLRAAFVFTVLVAVLIDPHLVDYDLTVLVAAAVVGAALVPRLLWAIIPLYLVTMLRAQIPIAGAANVQLAAPLLVCCAVVVYRKLGCLESKKPADPITPEEAGKGARASFPNPAKVIQDVV
jgi:hypothetical protein